MSRRDNGIGKFLLGAGMGVGLGLLFAPQSGDKTRKELTKKLNNLIEELKKVDYNEVKDSFVEKIQDLKTELEDLNKEKVLEIAKIKAEDLKKKSEELYNEAVSKGKPMLEEMTKDVKNKAADIFQNVANSLKEEQKTAKKTKTTEK